MRLSTFISSVEGPFFQNIDLLVENKMFEKAITVLAANLELPSRLGGSRSLFLLANLVHLSYLDQHVCSSSKLYFS